VAGRIPALIDADPVVRQIRIRDQEVRLPGEPIPGVRRIVLVQNGTLEDLIFSLPAIHAVRDAYPHAWLAVLVRKSTAPLVRLVPVIQEILIAGPGTHELEASIRSFNADLLISLSRGSGVAMAGWRVKVPHRIGTGFRVFSSRFTRQVKERRRNGTLHEVDYGLSFAHRVGATAGPPQFGIHVPEKAKVGVRHWLELQGLPDKVIVIHPADSMNVSAFNALLKLLEEPAADTYLILVCHRTHSVPATIRSRCQLFCPATPDTDVCLNWLDSFTSGREESQKLLALADGQPLLAKELYCDGGSEEFAGRRLGLLGILKGSVTVSQASALWSDVEIPEFLQQIATELQRILSSLSMDRLSSIQGRAAFRILDEIARLKRVTSAGANPSKQLLVDTLLSKIHRELGEGLLGDTIPVEAGEQSA
jgi:hypothetical protein